MILKNDASLALPEEALTKTNGVLYKTFGRKKNVQPRTFEKTLKI